jgi:signal peptidase I
MAIDRAVPPQLGHPVTPLEPASLEPAPVETAPEVHSGGFMREMMETLLLAVVLFVAVRAVVQNTRVEGHSMEPTLHDGQHVMVNKLIYDVTEPRRGDIVVLHSPEGGPKPLIKRVIGLPGDEVRLVEGQVYVGDVRLDESYLPAYHGSETWGPYTLKADEYLVLGDNRDNSNDSRRFGPVQRAAIIGKAWFSLWPLQYGLTIGSQVSATSAEPTP